MMLVDPYRFGPGGAATVEFVIAATDGGAALSTHSLAGVALGDAATNRLIVIAVHFNGNIFADCTLLAATIAGVSASIDAQASQSHGSDGGVGTLGAAIISAVVPSGTSGTIELQFASTVRAYIGVYRCVGILNPVAIDTASASFSGSSVTIFCDVQQNGALIAAAGDYSQESQAITAGATEDYHDNPWFAFRTAIGASHAVTSTEANRAITLDRTSGVLDILGGFVAASFR